MKAETQAFYNNSPSHPSMIGLIGQKKDPQVILVKERLEDMGRKARVIDFRPFPKNAPITVKDSSIIYEENDLMDFSVFYLRQLGYLWPIPQKEMSEDEWKHYYGHYMEYLTAERETLSLKHSVIRILDMERTVVNPYDSFIYHRLKFYEDFLFRKKGFNVPDSFATNDLNTVEKEKYVYKGLAGGLGTHMVDDEFFKQHSDIFEQRPGLFQRYIDGKNLRIYVVGNEVVGAGFLLQEKKHVDSRIGQTGVEVFEPPEDIKEIAVKATETLEMKFSGVDFMVTEGGEYYLLEANPSPMFAGYEYMTHHPVSQKLAEFLVSCARR